MTNSSKPLRIVAIVVGAMSGLILIAWVTAWLVVQSKRTQQFTAHTVDIPVPYPLSDTDLVAIRAERAAGQGGEAGADPLSGVDLSALASERAIARGKHLVDARYGCNVCHGASFGGGVMMDAPPIGSLHGPNLTSGKGGVVANYDIADWDHIVRHGIKPDGTPAVMPSEDYVLMSDHELSDIVAYIRSLPPVDNEVAKPSFGPIGIILLATGQFPLSATKVDDHQRAHAKEPPAARDTPEFGAHLAATCVGCHRENLAGGPMPFGPPNWPPAANLTPHATGLASWSFEDFDKAMTQGLSKDGRALREPMTHVLPGTKAMTPTERKAMWTYLKSVAALPVNR